MGKREGKCKWEYIKEGDDAPGECIGNRGQAECDDKDKNTCRQLKREGKCKWLLSPKDRKTPTGTCLGEAECIGKTRRVCHRFRMQEGKCKWKPDPANEVTIKTTVQGFDCTSQSETKIKAIEKKLAKTIADKAVGGDETAVVLKTSCGSIKVEATIDLEERIGIMEAENEGQNVNLVEEMKAIKDEVATDLEKDDMKKNIVQDVASLGGVSASDLTVTETETGTNGVAATKAPETMEPSPGPGGAPSPGSSPAPSPGGAPA